VLQSCILPWTFPAWRVYSSGKNPGKLGVFWFSNVDWTRREFHLNDATSFQSPDLWDHLNVHHLRTGVIDMPATYPPRPLDGFMISGYPAEDDKPYTYPKELKAKLKASFGYKTYAESDPQNREAYLEEQQEIIRSRFATARYLLDQVDFLHLTIFCIDQIQHRFWDDEGLFKTWEVLDEELGHFVTEPDYTYLFMSDHGFGPDPIADIFQLNTWLTQEGYLKVQRRAADMLYRLGLTKRKLRKFMEALGIAKWLRRNMPDRVRRAMPLRQGETGEAMMFDRAPLIDWEHSEVLADGHGLLYFNPDLSSDRRLHLQQELREQLSTLHAPITGLPIASHVYTREEIYTGPFLTQAPELILLSRDGCLVKDGVGGSEIFQPPETERWNAKHAPDGLFMAWGRHVQPGVTVQGASLVDLAPTSLHMMGCPIPKAMDGRVLREIFPPGSEPDERATMWTDSEPKAQPKKGMTEEEDATIAERLQNLGYI
jgi:predicted AlkP superfamily phosphohydrolase/phosphomutase